MAKRRPSSRSSQTPRSRGGSGRFPWALAILAGLAAFGLYLYFQDQKTDPHPSVPLEERARQIMGENPDAEVWAPAPESEKKKPLTPPRPAETPARPSVPPTPPPTSTPRPVPPAPPPAPPSVTPAPAPAPPPQQPAQPPPTPAPEPSPLGPAFTPPPSVPAPTAPEPVLRPEPVPTDTPRTKFDIAAWQIALERRHFSCGTIEGDFGKRSRRAVLAYQRNQRLPLTGELDVETRLRLGKPGLPFTEQVITAQDMALVSPTPDSWRAKATVPLLGYNDAWEMAAEKFHTIPSFLRELNPGLTDITEGTVLLAPNLGPSIPFPKVGSIEIVLSETTLYVYDTQNRLVAVFPCSIAANKNKRPDGELRVANIAPNPNYTFNPAVLVEQAAAEGITNRMILPPGPNNPVGMAWIGLSLPGYGIHGTPDPSAISRTGSLGCFRLANWNAVKLVHNVKPGIPVRITE